MASNKVYLQTFCVLLVLSLFFQTEYSLAAESQGSVLSVNYNEKAVYTDLGNHSLAIGDYVLISNKADLKVVLKVVGTSRALSKLKPDDELAPIGANAFNQINMGFDVVKIDIEAYKKTLSQISSQTVVVPQMANVQEKLTEQHFDKHVAGRPDSPQNAHVMQIHNSDNKASQYDQCEYLLDQMNFYKKETESLRLKNDKLIRKLKSILNMIDHQFNMTGITNQNE